MLKSGPDDLFSLSLLEFNKLLGIIADFAHSDASRKVLLAMYPLSDRGSIEKRLGQTSEIMRIYDGGGTLSILQFSDIEPLLARVAPEGAVLEALELAEFMPVLDNISAIESQIRQHEGLLQLNELADSLNGFPDILRVLERSIDSEGNILDSASRELAELRGQIRRLESRIRKKLEELVRDVDVSVFLQDDFITNRSGRWVIPVRMDSKGQVQGVVHDVSKSGETAFIEPLSIINLSNELENLVAAQKSEEIRILRSISARIRAAAGYIGVEYRIVVYIDAVHCIARFADMFRMQIPQINESGGLCLVNARHPLLMMALQRAGVRQEVVPLNVTLGGDCTVMVITGSNAGGKTIAIKTIGLLQIMALTGMPVPADSASSFPLFDKLLIDIGDEQSIENNLSTFSAHMSNISRILKAADARALVLIDELGTGTDPDEGGALACAVLKELKESKALVFATTHLTEIKGFVYRTEGMVNASMEFDQEALTPLYRLRIGEPGQSHALEIARRYGLPDSIVDSAKAMLGGMKVEFDDLISDLSEKRDHYEKALDDITKERLVIEERNRALGIALSEAESRQKQLLADAYREAAEIVAKAKREMHALLQEARKMDREKSREAIKQAELAQESLVGKITEYEGPANYSAPSIDEIMEGDVVYVKSLAADAPVVEINLKHNRIKVKAGGKEVEVPASEIAHRRGKPATARQEPVTILKPDDEAVSRINLVGKRVDEALSQLEPFLNHASLAGFSEVTVVHGIGAGILLKAVREHVEHHPLVKSFRRGEPREGGNGVTILTMT
ncbi:MAG: endonuclease MutS2 [Dissulfurispiraceae bacterium]